MLPITGYVDRWSVRPGEEINFMIGVRGGGRYRARVARVVCGDPNPQGPGYREIPVAWVLEGEHDGEEQRVAKGLRGANAPLGKTGSPKTGNLQALDCVNKLDYFKSRHLDRRSRRHLGPSRQAFSRQPSVGCFVRELIASQKIPARRYAKFLIYAWKR
jgi:hypothetical protein